MTGIQKMRVLRIVQLPQSRTWYSDKLGQLVPLTGFVPGSWRSREPDGRINFVAQKNAEMVVVPVPVDQLGEYPWCWSERVATPGSTSVRPAPASANASAPANAPPSPPPAKGCAQRCDMLGVCHGLSDCEEQAGTARVAAATTARRSQSRRASLVEAMTNLAVGFGVSLVITALVLPAYGHQVTLSQNLQITAIFTVASLLRSYALRRMFNFWTSRA